MAELYVPGLDLSTGLAVDAGEQETWEWQKKGHNGDGSLVCLECYLGDGALGGARAVPLVPRGKVGGVRRRYFAHPPGMAPPGGHHAPEGAWHWAVKHQLARWAKAQGAAARVEARAADGRRRSDVSVTLPGGQMLALEVQFSPITDGEILARRADYLGAGITVVWVWHSSPPHVLYRFGDPGWVYDLPANRVGLLCGSPHPPRLGGDSASARALGSHWPPCPGDDTLTRWMPLADLRLADGGLRPSQQVLQCLVQEGAATSRQAGARPAGSPVAPWPRRRASVLPVVLVRRGSRQDSGPIAPRRGRDAGRPDGRSRAVVQAQAVVGLARRIDEIEARIAVLDVSTIEQAVSGGGPRSAAEIGMLASQLKILRRQLALLPSQTAR